MALVFRVAPRLSEQVRFQGDVRRPDGVSRCGRPRPGGRSLRSRSVTATEPVVPTKLIIVVRADLGMGRGKVAAQAAHAAVGGGLASVGTAAFRAWLRDGQPKVVLRAER